MGDAASNKQGCNRCCQAKIQTVKKLWNAIFYTYPDEEKIKRQRQKERERLKKELKQKTKKEKKERKDSRNERLQQRRATGRAPRFKLDEDEDAKTNGDLSKSMRDSKLNSTGKMLLGQSI